MKDMPVGSVHTLVLRHGVQLGDYYVVEALDKRLTPPTCRIQIKVMGALVTAGDILTCPRAVVESASLPDNSSGYVTQTLTLRLQPYWRVTADDDAEKEWDSTTAQDALIDAEQAIEDGATRVVIERIRDPMGHPVQEWTELRTKETS